MVCDPCVPCLFGLFDFNPTSVDWPTNIAMAPRHTTAKRRATLLRPVLCILHVAVPGLDGVESMLVGRFRSVGYCASSVLAALEAVGPR